MNLALHQLFLCCGWHLFFLSLSCVYFFLKTSKSSQVKLSERAQKIPLAKKYQPKGSFLNIPSKTSFESKKAYTQIMKIIAANTETYFFVIIWPPFLVLIALYRSCRCGFWAGSLLFQSPAEF